MQTEDKSEWYTTTFSIPKWLGEKLQKEASERKLRGMNIVVVNACINYFFEEEKREKHNEIIKVLYDAEVIDRETRDKLWL